MDLRKLASTFLRVLSGAVGLAMILFGGVLLFMFTVTVDYAWEGPVAALFSSLSVAP